MLIVIAAACGCTGTTVESQPAGEPQEDMGAPGTAPEQREQPRAGYASAAAALGVTEEELQAALKIPEGMAEGCMPGGREGATPPEPS